MDLFSSTRKMGGPEFSKSYAEKLLDDIEESLESFKKHNDSKNIFSAARTPAVLFTVMVVSYLLAGIFGIVGLESVANLLNLVVVVFLGLTCVWLYVRYSGEYRNVSVQIDMIADWIWDNVLSQAYSKAAQHAAQQAVKTKAKKN